MSEQLHIDRMFMAAIHKSAPHVLERCLSKCGDERQPHRAELLEELMQIEGAQSVLGLSHYVLLETSSSSLIYLLLNSPTPQAMIQKLSFYENYFYMSRQLQLRGASDRHLLVENCTKLDDIPTTAEELFLAGALETLLTMMGCRELKMEWLSARSEHLGQVLQELERSKIPIEVNTCWRFSWQQQQRPEQIRGLDEFLLSNTDPFIAPYKSSLTQRVEEYLAEDLNIRPNMDEMAERLGISARSLQRKLKEEGSSYSRLYSELRIKTAARLLRQSDANLTEISLLSGFSDSAHFSREFKKIQKMSPTAYRNKFRKQDD